MSAHSLQAVLNNLEQALARYSGAADDAAMAVMPWTAEIKDKKAAGREVRRWLQELEKYGLDQLPDALRGALEQEDFLPRRKPDDQHAPAQNLPANSVEQGIARIERALADVQQERGEGFLALLDCGASIDNADSELAAALRAFSSRHGLSQLPDDLETRLEQAGFMENGRLTFAKSAGAAR